MTEVENHPPGHNHETIDEMDEDNMQQSQDDPSWKDRVQKLTVRAASTWAGQFAIRQGDRLLWTIEKTAKWSCPIEKGMTKNTVSHLFNSVY